MKYRRVVLKVGSSSLIDGQGYLHQASLEHIVALVKESLDEGVSVVVVSSGAVAAGKAQLGWSRKVLTMPEKQAAAAVGQGLLMHNYQQLFSQQHINVAQLLLTKAEVEHRDRFTHMRNTVEVLLRHHIVPIVNENDTVAVDEIRFGDNDSLAALVALATEADLLVILSDIDGLYTANPRTDSQAKRIDRVEKITELIEHMAGGSGSAVGTGGMKTKITAAKIATQAGIDVVIAHHQEPSSLRRILQGEKLGTLFLGQNEPISAKKSWISFGSKAHGQIYVDRGAAEALRHQAASLLLPGIVRLEGEFKEGDTVEMYDDRDEVIGRGITNLASNDLKMVLAKKQAGEDVMPLPAIIHRNYLVLERKAADDDVIV